MQMPEISREIYKAVKKYDRQQLARFCADVYMQGYNDGRESVPGVDVEKICEAIAATPGIGQKRMAEIKKNIESLFE